MSASASSTDQVDISGSVPVLTEDTRRQFRKAVDLPLRLFYRHQGLRSGSIEFCIRGLWKDKLSLPQTENDLTAALLLHVKRDAAVFAKMKSAIELHTILSDSEKASDDAEMHDATAEMSE